MFVWGCFFWVSCCFAFGWSRFLVRVCYFQNASREMFPKCSVRFGSLIFSDFSDGLVCWCF